MFCTTSETVGEVGPIKLVWAYGGLLLAVPGWCFCGSLLPFLCRSSMMLDHDTPCVCRFVLVFGRFGLLNVHLLGKSCSLD